MSELTYLVLRIGFLIILWLMVFSVIFAIRSDLFGPKVRTMPQPQPTPDTQRSNPPAPIVSDQPATAGSLHILEGPLAGTQISLGDDPITIGRSSDSGLILTDDYTSNYHARLIKLGDQWRIEDVGSTNGTYLAGVQVTAPIPVPLNTPIKIGTSVLELRR